jgi:hypothetical protein
MRGLFGAVDAGKQCATASLGRRDRTAPQLLRLRLALWTDPLVCRGSTLP